MKRNAKMGALVLLVGSSLAVAGCNPGGSKDPQAQSSSAGGSSFSKDLSGELKTSGYNPSDEVGQSRSDLATEKVDPVKVTMDTTNFDTQKFAAQAQAGNVPDLIQVDRPAVGTLADKGLIMPMDECYALYDVDPTERYYEAAIKDVTYDGKVYAVPQFFQAGIIIADKDVMNDAGVKVEDLDTSKPDQVIDVAKKMYQESGGNPTVLGFDPDLPGSAATWLAIFGGKPHDEDGKPTLEDPKNVEALTWMKDLMDAQGGYAKVKSFKDSMDVFGDKNQYVNKQVGAQTWGQWYINVLSNTKDEVSVAATPLRDSSGKTIGIAGGSALAIPSGAKNPSAACAWAINVASPEAWEAAGEARAKTVKEKNSINTGLFTGSPEADKSVREKFVTDSGNDDFDQLINTSYEALDNTFSFGGSPVGQQTDEALKNAVQVALTGEKPPQEALKEAQATAMRAWDQSSLGK